MPLALPSGQSLRVALRTDDCFSDVSEWCDKHGFGGFAVREGDGTDNVHWHWLLFAGSKTLKAIRSLFNRELPGLRGNGKYSMSEVDDLSKYERYLCKGESDYVLPVVAWRNSMTYDDARVKELHDAYWEENKKVRRKRVRGSAIDSVIDVCKEDAVHWNDRRLISEKYIKLLGEQGKPINLFSMRANINAVQYALCPDDTILNALVDRLEQY